MHGYDGKDFSGSWKMVQALKTDPNEIGAMPVSTDGLTYFLNEKAGKSKVSWSIKKIDVGTHKLKLDIDLQNGDYKDSVANINMDFFPINATLGETEDSFSFTASNIEANIVYLYKMSLYHEVKTTVSLNVTSTSKNNISISLFGQNEDLPKEITIVVDRPYQGYATFTNTVLLTFFALWLLKLANENFKEQLSFEQSSID